MTSRERVLAALRHEQPDRTPRDFWAEPPTMQRLFAHVGHSYKDRLLDALDVDVRHLEAPAPVEREVAPGLFQNFWGERYVFNPTPWGPMREDAKGALADATDLAALEKFPWPSPDCLDRKGMTALIHSLGGRALYHSCGTIRPFIADLIACGVDVLDPIQPTGPEMQPESLKREFGDRLCFHGGIDMQNLLPKATPAAVTTGAQHYCDVLGQNGGYILGPAHLFQPDVPPENILALYQAR